MYSIIYTQSATKLAFSLRAFLSLQAYIHTMHSYNSSVIFVSSHSSQLQHIPFFWTRRQLSNRREHELAHTQDDFIHSFLSGLKVNRDCVHVERTVTLHSANLPCPGINQFFSPFCARVVPSSIHRNLPSLQLSFNRYSFIYCIHRLVSPAITVTQCIFLPKPTSCSVSFSPSLRAVSRGVGCSASFDLFFLHYRCSCVILKVDS